MKAHHVSRYEIALLFDESSQWGAPHSVSLCKDDGVFCHDASWGGILRRSLVPCAFRHLIGVRIKRMRWWSG